jgi:hypothetical protein
MATTTSLSISEVKTLQKYKIVSPEQYAAALLETNKYNIPANFRGVITLERSKIAAASEGVPLKQFLDEQAKKKQEMQKRRTEMLGRLQAAAKSDYSIDLEDPIYLSCSRLSKRPVDGSTTVNRSYLTVKSKALDYIKIYNAWNTGVAGTIDYRSSLFDAPIKVSKFGISALTSGRRTSDERNNITLDRVSLKLTHNEYIDYSLGRGKKPLYPNNTYSYNCDFSSAQTIEWQKKTSDDFQKRQSEQEKDRAKKLQKKLDERKF